jgi:hypothetical protein
MEEKKESNDASAEVPASNEISGSGVNLLQDVIEP